jgi:para-nitrobenzyl esterase
MHTHRLPLSNHVAMIDKGLNVGSSEQFGRISQETDIIGMETKFQVLSGVSAIAGVLLVSVFLGSVFLGSPFLGSPIPGLSASAQALQQTRVVHIADGDVRGATTNEADEFLGIPYAAPPVGDLRWQPPRAPAPWTGTLAALKFGKTCAQSQRGVFAAPSQSEDCLYLNVFAPHSADAPTAKAPVMVWFHGGGLFSGESDDYDGSGLVGRGHVVVVTLNYRVGALGFLSHPAINGEGHPAINYGIMDQQMALTWVQHNIAAFGGDPGNVTIFGQSGGGTAVMANLVSPLSKGLFHRAINESGTRIGTTDPTMAMQAGKKFAAAAGCEDQSAACLRALTVAQVVDHQGDIVKYLGATFPVVDGTIITHTAVDAFSNGAFNRVPIVNGLVSDEQAFFLPEANTHKPLTKEEFEDYAAAFGAQHKDMLLSKYPLASYASPSLAEIAMAQNMKSCVARFLDRAWAKYGPVYAYEFDDRTAPSYFPDLSYPMRAYHTAELQYLFPLFHGGQGTPHPLNDAQQTLSHEIVSYWTTFALNGDPNPDGAKELPTWPRYSPEADNVLVLNSPVSKAADGYGNANDCAMWDPVLAFK